MHSLNEHISQEKPHRWWLPLALLTGLLLLASRSQLAAQSAVMNITGVASPLNPPLLSNLPLIGDQYGGSASGAFTFTYNGPEAAELTFLLTIEVDFGDGSAAIIDEEESEPATFEPNQTYSYTSLTQGRPSIRFPGLSVQRVLNKLPANYRLHVANTNSLPGGSYSVTLEALLDGSPIGLGFTTFTVSSPDPPTLIAPDDEELVEQSLITFSWLNVVLPGALPQYDFKLVEVRPNQSKEDAYRNNPAYYEQPGMQATTLTYTPALPPLESGKTYAWGVQVKSEGQPFINEGVSEIYSFTYSQIVDLTTAFTVISPTDGAEVSGDVAFSWQIAGLPTQSLQYQVLISNQQSGAALNQPVWLSAPQYSFRPDPAPTTDQSYVWAVRVRPTGEGGVKFRDVSGDVVDVGDTEQFMFRYQVTPPPVAVADPQPGPPNTGPPNTGPPSVTPPDTTQTAPPGLALSVSTLELIPGFATLNNIQVLAPQTQPDGYLLNGTTTLSLQTSPPQNIAVRVENLKLTNPTNPSWLSGNVTATGLNLNLGSAPLELNLTGISTSLPGDGTATLLATGQLIVDGGKGTCALPNVNIGNGRFEINNCATSQPITLTTGNATLALDLTNVGGVLYADEGGLGGFLETDVAATLTTAGQNNPAQINGKLQLSTLGFSGTLTGENLDLKLGQAPMEAHLTGVTVRFPAEGGTLPEVKATGNVVFFGDETKTCEISSFTLSSSEAALTLGPCAPEQMIPLLKGQTTDLIWLHLQRIDNSTLSFDGNFTYDVTLQGALHVAHESGSCALEFNGAKLSNAGFEVGQVQPLACGLTDPRLNLGFAWLGLQRLNIAKLTFGNIGWDFELAFKPTFEIPSLNNFKQEISTSLATISKTGIVLPAFDFNSTDANGLMSFRQGPLQVALSRVRTAGLTIDWANIDLNSLIHWQGIVLDVTLSVPPDMQLRIPGAERSGPPSCLNQGLPGTLSISGTALRTEVQRSIAASESCSLVMGSDGHQAVFTVQQFDAALSATYENGQVNFAPPTASLEGKLALGAPFVCSGQAPPALGGAAGQTKLTLDGNGHITGTLSNVAAGCTLPVGNHRATLSNDELTLALDGTTPTAQFKGTASLQLGAASATPGNNLNGMLQGSIDVDLADGTINDYNLTGTNIAWAIPNVNPIFNFKLARATLTRDSLTISDADNTVDLGNGQSVSVGFTNVKVNLARMQIESGQVTFGGQFALDVDLNSLNEPVYKAVSFNSAPQARHLMLKLDGGVTLDRQGLKFSPTTQVQADLNYQTESINLTSQYNVQFAKDDNGGDFAFRFSPFGIQSGRVEMVNGQGIRYFWGDQTGFYPDAGLLPNRLPLPSETVAYLVLRGDDPANTPKVEYDRQADGSFLLYTRPGEPVELKIPALNDATLNITITREQALTIQPKVPFPITSGEVLIEATTTPIPTPANFPLTPRSLRFGMIDGQARLIVTGTLKELRLPNTNLADACAVELGTEQILGQWQLRGGIDCVISGVEPLAVAGQQVKLALSKATGSVVVPLGTGAAPEVTGSIEGQFRILPVGEGDPLTINAQLALQPTGGFRASFVNTSGTTLPDFVLFEKGGIKLTVTTFTPHTLAFEDGAFAFNLDMGLKAQYTTQNGRTFNVPGLNFGMSNAGLKFKGRSESGTSEPTFKSIGPVAVKLLNFKMPEGVGGRVLNIFSGDVTFADLAAVLPSTFSMKIKLSDAQAQKYPDLASEELDINQMGYDAEFRVFTGNASIEPNRPFPIRFDSTGQKRLDVTRLEAVFEKNADNTQAARFGLSGLASIARMTCQGTRPSFEASLGTEELRGSVNDVCFDSLPDSTARLTYSLTGGRLDFAYGGMQNELKVVGTASATLKLDQTNRFTASGRLGIDLLTGAIFESALTFGPFTMGYPVNNPTFSFAIQEATLDGSNLVINGNSTLNLGGQGAAITATFNDAKFGLNTLGLQDGSITFNAPLAFNIPIGSTDGWALVRANNEPLPADSTSNLFQLGLPANLTLTREGISVSGNATAKLRHNRLDETWAARMNALSLGFTDFHLALADGPRVSTGKASINWNDPGGQSQEVATYDTDGFHLSLSGLVAVTAEMLPDTLNLSSAAYVLLRQNGSLAVTPNIDTNARTIQIRTTSDAGIDIVFPKFGPDARATATFDLALNYDDLTKIIGINQVGVATNDALSKALFKDLPVALTDLAVEKPENEAVRVTAGVRINLPSAILDTTAIGDPEATIPPSLQTRFQISENGIENLDLNAGNTDCTARGFKPVNLPTNKGTVKVCHVRLAFEGTTPTAFSVKGNLTSEYLKRKGGDQPLSMDFNGGHDTNGWTFKLDRIDQPADSASASQPKAINLKVGTFTPAPENGFSFSTSDGFAVTLNGTLTVNAFGRKKDGYTPPAFSVKDLRIGTKGVCGEVALEQQAFGMFDNKLNVTVNKLALDLPGSTSASGVQTCSSPDQLAFIMEGEMNLMKKGTFAFSGFRIGLDGRIELGTAAYTLAQGQEITLIPNVYKLNKVALSFGDDFLPKLTATGPLELPKPFTVEGNAEAGVSLSVATDGTVNIEPQWPDISLAKKIEFNVGNKPASLELTSFKPDIKWDQLDESKIRLAADFRVGDQMVQFGDKDNMDQKWGILLEPTKLPKWQITRSEVNLDFDAGLFALNLTEVKTPDDANGFAVALGGTARMKVGGVSGSVKISGFTIAVQDNLPAVTDIGNYSNFDLKVLNKFQLAVRTVGFCNQQCSYTKTQQAGNNTNNPRIEETTISVDHYMSITGGSLTLPTGKGEVEEISFYQKGEEFGLYLKGFAMRIGTEASPVALLTAHLELEAANGGFLLRAAGSGTFKSKPEDVGLAFAGKISTMNDQLSFGLFASVEATFTLIPGVLDVTKAGIGFFYKPEQADLDVVLQTIKFDLPRPDMKPNMNGLTFSVLFYGKFGLAGSAGNYSADVEALLDFGIDIENERFTGGFQAVGRLLKTDDITINAYLRIESAADKFTLMGGASTAVNFASIVEGSAELNFSIIKLKDSDTVWAINGEIRDFTIVKILKVNATFAASNDGFFMQISQRIEKSIVVIELSAGFEVTLWWRGANNFGAYFILDGKIEVLSIARVEAAVKGAFLNDRSGWLLYGAAHVSVEVLGFGGELDVWLAIKNDGWDGGTGRDETYWKRVLAAKNTAKEMETKIAQLQVKLKAAQAAPPGFTERQLKAAASTLISLPVAERQQFHQSLVAGEDQFLGVADESWELNGIEKYKENRTRIIQSIEQSIQLAHVEVNKEREDLANALTALNQELDNFFTRIGQIKNQLSNVVQDNSTMGDQACPFDAALLKDPAKCILDPAKLSAELTWRGNQPPLSTTTLNLDQVDRNNAQNKSLLVNFQTMGGGNARQLNDKYLSAMEATIATINELAINMDGLGVLRPPRLVQYTVPDNRPMPLSALTQTYKTYLDDVNRYYAAHLKALDGFVASDGETQRIQQVATELNDWLTYLVDTGTKTEYRQCLETKRVNEPWNCVQRFLGICVKKRRYWHNECLRYPSIQEVLTAEQEPLIVAALDLVENRHRLVKTLELRQSCEELCAAFGAIAAAFGGEYDTAACSASCPVMIEQIAQTEAQDYRSQLVASFAQAQGIDMAEVEQQVKAKVRETGLNLWNQIPTYGMQILKPVVKTEADGIRKEYSEIRADVFKGYRDLTLAMDSLYSIRKKMLFDLYGMLDDYMTFWTENADHLPKEWAGGGWIAPETWLQKFKRDIALQLEPPTIASIRVRDGATPGFSWQTTSQGGVAEYAYNLSIQEDGADPFETGFVAVGSYIEGIDEPLVTQNALTQEARTVHAEFRLRARSSGGVVTISEPVTATWNLKLDLNNLGLPAASLDPETAQRQSDNNLLEDNTPPRVVELGIPTGTGNIKYILPLNRSDEAAARALIGYRNAPIYWTNAKTALDLRITAEEDRSNIAGLKYAFHLLPHSGAGQWQPLIPPDEAQLDGTSRRVHLPRFQLRNLPPTGALENSRTYQLAVLATNSLGVESTNIPEIVYLVDHTGPVLKSTTPTRPPIAISNTPVEILAPLGNADRPAYVNTVGSPGSATQRFPVSFSIEEQGIGVGEVKYAVTTSSSPDEIEPDQAKELCKTYFSNTVSCAGMTTRTYTPDQTEPGVHYLHIWAYDHLGNQSEVYDQNGTLVSNVLTQSLGEVMPDYPLVRAQRAPGGVNLFWTRKPSSDIMGYQYSIGSGPGQTDIRPWNTDDAQGQKRMDVTFEAEELTQYSDHPPHRFVSQADLLKDRPADQPFYINVIAIGQGGTPSKVVSTGPFTLDVNLADSQ